MLCGVTSVQAFVCFVSGEDDWDQFFISWIAQENLFCKSCLCFDLNRWHCQQLPLFWFWSSNIHKVYLISLCKEIRFWVLVLLSSSQGKLCVFCAFWSFHLIPWNLQCSFHSCNWYLQQIQYFREYCSWGSCLFFCGWLLILLNNEEHSWNNCHPHFSCCNIKLQCALQSCKEAVCWPLVELLVWGCVSTPFIGLSRFSSNITLERN